MDLYLLILFNKTLTHPWLDGLMAGVTTFGFALLPALGVVLGAVKSQRRVGMAILAALLASLFFTLAFQYLILRPRPDVMRLILTTPNFPAFPSGHAAAAFSVAMVLGLAYRRWFCWLAALSGAGLIAYSRLYLGHHYFSDVVGGAMLGASIGAACYGLLVLPQPDWRWLLWPQIALGLIISQIAYLGLLPLYLLRVVPFTDKILHFLLFGAIVFWLNLWLNGRTIQAGPWAVPIAIAMPLTIALVEECLQSFSPLRSFDLLDAVSDTAGMFFFWWLSTKLMVYQFRANKLAA